MNVSSVTSGASDILDIYAQKVSSEVEMTQKIAKINLELKMEAEKIAMAEEVLENFYA